MGQGRSVLMADIFYFYLCNMVNRFSLENRVLILGVRKVWDPLRDFWTKNRRSTKFRDCINKILKLFFDYDKGPGPFERFRIVGAPTFMETCTFVVHHWTRHSKIKILTPQVKVFWVERLQNGCIWRRYNYLTLQ